MASRWTSVCMSVHPSIVHPSVHISFLDDNLNKHQWIFTNFSMCIDIVELWFGIANGQETRPYFHFQMITCKCQGILTKLVHALILRRFGLGLLMGKFRQCLIELSAHDTIMAGYYS